MFRMKPLLSAALARPSGRSGVAVAGGLVVGAVVAVVWFVALKLAEEFVPWEYREYAGRDEEFVMAVTIAVPSSLVAALLAARILRLRRPWLLAAGGLFLALIFGV